MVHEYQKHAFIYFLHSQLEHETHIFLIIFYKDIWLIQIFIELISSCCEISINPFIQKDKIFF